MRRGKEGSGVRSLTESQEDVSMYICTVGLQKNRMGVEDRPVYSLALSLSIDPARGRSQAPKDKAIFVLKFFSLAFHSVSSKFPTAVACLMFTLHCDLSPVGPQRKIKGSGLSQTVNLSPVSHCVA